jgi:DNA helicase-2/ATP-dependent DNA helicase PcrA
VVFVVGCEQGILPLAFGRDEAVDAEEERRLLYVGMTRARERLILSWARRRLWRGKIREQTISPLLRAVSAELCELRSTEPATRPIAAPSRQLELFGS